ncbi:DUF3575 domain-containing protein [Chryseotalea sanaruensis]|uniref:DUF3575 domain-containing protein n=1 Tax=Chryseotalea sanaruensis TaxID=2482724 RepID=A0A401UBC7_9BACT|nr:DUF3575 domain-containing protein [Chryseotalea sanaruensis]GCC52189.1 DUF3575 domain-containing protein [Chryseotalea sanaruensis]
MKKRFALPVLLSLFLIPTLMSAQENTFKINILSPIFKTLNLQYEHKIKENSSVQLGFFYTGYSVGETSFSGFGITPEYRFYLSSTEAPQGVYVAPFLRYQSFNLSEESTDSEATFTTIGGGAIIGKQWIFKEKVVLDLFIGPAYNSGSVDVKSGTDSFDVGTFDGFGLRTGFCLGIAF